MSLVLWLYRGYRLGTLFLRLEGIIRDLLALLREVRNVYTKQVVDVGRLGSALWSNRHLIFLVLRVVGNHFVARWLVSRQLS